MLNKRQTSNLIDIVVCAIVIIIAVSGLYYYDLIFDKLGFFVISIVLACCMAIIVSVTYIYLTIHDINDARE